MPLLHEYNPSFLYGFSDIRLKNVVKLRLQAYSYSDLNKEHLGALFVYHCTGYPSGAQHVFWSSSNNASSSVSVTIRWIGEKFQRFIVNIFQLHHRISCRSICIFCIGMCFFIIYGVFRKQCVIFNNSHRSHQAGAVQCKYFHNFLFPFRTISFLSQLILACLPETGIVYDFLLFFHHIQDFFFFIPP